MKKISLIVFIYGLLFSSFAQNDSTFCVFELYTSEGCSSCPSADNVFNVAAENANNSINNHLYIAKHVTYWNYLGWTDPFGISSFDQEQTAYKNAGVTNVVGTPMIIRNGQTYIGYSGGIQSNNLNADAFIQLTFDTLKNNMVFVNYEVTGNTIGRSANFFLLESDLVSVVTAGENAGSTLHHNNVARRFISKTLDLTNLQGYVVFVLPPGCNHTKMRVVAFIRETSTMKIKGATKGFSLFDMVSIEELNTSESIIEIYPNPANDKVNIYIEEVQPGSEIKICIYDIQGRNCSNDENYKLSNGLFSFDIQHLKTGIYLMKIITSSGIILKEFYVIQ
ncbi:DUF1223 domain-containing protein [Bacteroidota bacterium]